jgi:hypothetical protein
MKNKNTIKDLIKLMEDNGESPHYIIGWLSSMIDGCAEGYPVKGFTIQHEIDSGVKFYQDKALTAGRKTLIDSELIGQILACTGKE